MTFTIQPIAFRARVCLTAAVFTVSGYAVAALPLHKLTLPNGATLVVVESPAIPMLDVHIDFDAGSRRDPMGKAGLARFTAEQASHGVSARSGMLALDENEVGQAWADLGAMYGSNASDDRLSFSLRTLTEPDLLAKAIALAARQIGEPAFADSVWQRDRQKAIASLKESYTRPSSVAWRAYSQAVYGSHPYGYEVSEGSLGRISVADMRQFYASGVVACRARVSMVGAVTLAQAASIAQQLLSRVPQTPCAELPALPTVPEVAPLAQPVQHDIAFDAAQAHVLMGQPGYKRNDPAFFPLLVGNYILGGGGFVSRLQNEVREKRGLTYGAYSSFSPGLHAGAFTVSLETRPDQAAQALAVASRVVEDFVANGPTQAEVTAAKDNLIGGFGLMNDSNRKLLGNISTIAWNDLPLNYLDTWVQQIKKVTLQDIRTAMAAKLQPDNMVTIVLGATP
jgi:zinc protease